MAYDFREVWEREILRRDDPELTAAWRDAKLTDAADKEAMARLLLLDRVRLGDWDRERRMREKARARDEASAERRVVAREKQHPIGRAVAAERVRARLRQRDLAEAAGLTRDALARVERNLRRLSFDEACRLGDALGVPLDRFRAL